MRFFHIATQGCCCGKGKPYGCMTWNVLRGYLMLQPSQSHLSLEKIQAVFLYYTHQGMAKDGKLE